MNILRQLGGRLTTLVLVMSILLSFSMLSLANNQKEEEVKEDFVNTIVNVVSEAEKREVEEVSRAGGRSYILYLEVSAYNPYDPEQTKSNWDGLAYDGREAVPNHTISVDPKVIPLGSKVYVPNVGWFLAHDTGSYIKDYKVDIALGSNKECFAYGRKNVECIVIPPSEKFELAW